MADKMPNYPVERQRLVMELANMNATVERQRLENMELADRMERNDVNITATAEKIKEHEQKLIEFDTVER